MPGTIRWRNMHVLILKMLSYVVVRRCKITNVFHIGKQQEVYNWQKDTLF